MLVPVAVVGQAVATAALPALSQLFSEGKSRELDRVLLATLRGALALACLGAAAAVALAEPIVTLVFERGRFGPEETARVAAVLRVLALAVPAWVVQQIAVRGFYARGDTWRPMILGTAVALAVVPLYLALGPRFGAEGLAAAGVIGMSLNTVASLVLLRRQHGGPPLAPLAVSLARNLTVAAAAGLAAGAVIGGRGAALDFLLGAFVLALVAIPLAFTLGDEAMRDGLRRLARRLRGARVG
jgi:putative peptidoglycan lipid II flippase